VYGRVISTIGCARLQGMDGQELRRRREALGLSQADLGRLLGVMQNTVSRWELGLVVIRHPKILALALEAIETRELLKRDDE
jgi:transcriptional regulator with XRE-family HTH domain